jgi:quinol monooxygenase YgiN
MKTIVITHEVKNYSDWRKVYDADEANRSKAGFITSGEYQSEEDPNRITIIGEAPSVKAIQDFMTNPALKEAMEKGGVIGMPEVKILNKVN